MIILHDSPSTELSHIQAIGDLTEGFALFDYVSMRQPDGSSWIGQVVQPNQNLSTVGSRLDPTILHGLELMQTHNDVQAVRSVQVFDILILGQYDGQQLLTPRLRPLPGAVVQRLNAAETAAIIEIPQQARHADGSLNVIGELLNADGVSLCVDARKFNYHMMVAGGTGSGKSNVAANLISQAVRYGKCVLVHDAKPDYGLIDEPNSDIRVRHIWERFARYGLAPASAAPVTRVGFAGACNPNTVDDVVGFRASDFNPDLLAGLFFVGSVSTEQNAFEGFASAAHGLRLLVDNRQLESYTLDDILAEVNRRNADLNQVQAQDQIHPLTVGSIQRKVSSRRRQYPWLDSVGQLVREGPVGRLGGGRLDARARRVVPLVLDRLVEAGRIIVVDYRDMEEAAYAVILSFFLRESQRHQRRHRSPGIVQLVDEAHRIFDNNSRHGGTLGAQFERVMREGRSVDHSIVLSLQNASQIPPRVMNNLNSKFVMRQNSRAEADAATQTMGKEFALQAMRLGTGHALVSIHESRAVVLAQMAPSPYELMRTDLEEPAMQEAAAGEAPQEDDFPF